LGEATNGGGDGDDGQANTPEYTKPLHVTAKASMTVFTIRRLV
jgi:hypothetical protein